MIWVALYAVLAGVALFVHSSPLGALLLAAIGISVLLENLRSA